MEEKFVSQKNFQKHLLLLIVTLFSSIMKAKILFLLIMIVTYSSLIF